jgi:hypothetical protein
MSGTDGNGDIPPGGPWVVALGSLFGNGAYGRGPYSRVFGLAWASVDIPPCQPWTLIKACDCPSTVVWPA